jgi:tetratricopeptide (TPR) repeat protein
MTFGMRAAIPLLILSSLVLGQERPSKLRLCFEEAMNCAALIKDDYHQSDLMRELAGVQGRAGMAKEALETIDAMTDDYFRSLAYADVGTALGKAGKNKEAREVFEKGIKSTGSGEQDFKTPHGFSRIAIAFAELGDVDRALKIIPDTKGVFDEGTLHSVARVIALSGDLPRALKLVEDAPKKDHDHDWWLRGLATGFIQARDWKKACDVAALIADSSRKSGALVECAAAMTAADQWDEAANVADTVPNADDRIEAYSRIGLARLKAGKPLDEPRLKSSFELLDNVEHPYSKLYACLHLASWKKALGDSASALKLIQTAQDCADKVEDSDWHRFAIIGALAEAGFHDRAVAVAHSLSEDHRESALKVIGRVHAKHGDRDKLGKITTVVTDPFFLAEVGFEFAQAATSRGAKEEARQELKRSSDHFKDVHIFLFRRDEEFGNPEIQFLKTLMKSLQEAGLYDEALAAARKGEHAGVRAVVRSYASMETKAGRVEPALAWIQRIEDPRSRGLAFIGAAEGLLDR